MPGSAAELALQYSRLLDKRTASGSRCREHPLRREDLPDEITLQCLWADGQFGTSFRDDEANTITILDPGEWNKGAGPDFLNAKIEINGDIRHGDIELDAAPEDWERHGHGENPAFNQVLLHVAFLPPGGTWFTRNQLHKRVPRIEIPPGSIPPGVSLLEPASGSGACLPFWEQENTDAIDRILRMAAAYRFESKKRNWKQRANHSGEDQVLYENIAETLGYSANKTAMGMLARRMKLAIVDKKPEPLLFGAAGFLVPVLPERCSTAAKNYHKQLWDFWWKCRAEYEPCPDRSISWTFSGIRPTNHPQRRLAALAAIVSRWHEFRTLCESGTLRELESWFGTLNHPYWNTHTTLPSAELQHKIALVGSNRVADFALNHLFPMRGDDKAWKAYLDLPGGEPNSKVASMIRRISSSPESSKFLTAKAYRQQALLQIRRDFCLVSPCQSCPLPRQSVLWSMEAE